MSENKNDPRLFAPADKDGAIDDRKVFQDDELSALLDKWHAPRVSRQLDERVLASYRQRLAEERRSATSAIGQTAFEVDKMSQAARAGRDEVIGEFSQTASQVSEVLKMKQCPTCMETFADKFAFCPVDGTRLDAQTATVNPSTNQQTANQSAANESAVPLASAIAPVAVVAQMPPQTSNINATRPPTTNVARAMQNAEASKTSMANAEANNNGVEASSVRNDATPPINDTANANAADGASSASQPSTNVPPRVTQSNSVTSAISANATSSNGATDNGHKASNGKAAVAAAAIGATAAVAGAASAANASDAFVPRGEYHLTILEDKGLSARLTAELRAVSEASQLTFPEFKRAPMAFTGRLVKGYTTAFGRFLRTENVMPAIATAFVLVLSLVLAIVLYERFKQRDDDLASNDRVDQIIDFRDTNIPDKEPKPTPEKAIGASDDKGRVGFNKGRGEGSEQQFKKATGGGGGGLKEQLPAQQGALPPPSPIPAAIPKIPPTTMPQLPAGMQIDPTLARNLPFPNYGDPNSKSTAPSNGPGDKGGMGPGTGTGVGPGEGGGYGPGRGGNMGGGDNKGPGGGGPGGGRGGNDIDYDKPFSAGQVTRKAVITSKTEPGFTEDARKNGTTGVVRVRMLLKSDGSVSSVSAQNRLPDGLTEKAIAAAHQVRFIPAEKDGHRVSQWIVVEFSFNLY